MTLSTVTFCHRKCKDRDQLHFSLNGFGQRRAFRCTMEGTWACW